MSQWLSESSNPPQMTMVGFVFICLLILSGWYSLDCWTFFNWTWYAGASSWVRVVKCLDRCRQGHSEGLTLNPQKTTPFFFLFFLNLLNILQLNWVCRWIISYNVLWKLWIAIFEVTVSFNAHPSLITYRWTLCDQTWYVGVSFQDGPHLLSLV